MNDDREKVCTRCKTPLTPRGGKAPRFCPRCGLPVRPLPPTRAPGDLAPPFRRTSAAAILALVASLMGFFPFCFPMGLIGIVAGVIARGRIALSRGRLRGLHTANAGIVVGILSIAVWYLAWVFF